LLDVLPEWRVVDFLGDDAANGARLLYEKLTMTGEYEGRDAKLLAVMPTAAEHGLLIGFEHRPEGERYQPVAIEDEIERAGKEGLISGAGE
jgi:hypothetical protein